MAPLKNINLKVHVALFVVALFYAGNFSIAKLAMPQFILPQAFIMLRVMAGAVVFYLYYRLIAFEKIKEKKHFVQLAIAGFFGVALNMLAFFKGLSMTSSINASVLMLFAPAWVVVFLAINKEIKITVRIIAGLVLAFLGAAMLMNVQNFDLSNDGLIGDLLVVLNATSYGFYLYYVTRLLKIYKATTITAYIFIFGTIFVLPFGVKDFILTDWASFTTEAVLAVIYVIVGVTVTAYFLNSWAIQKSSSALVGSYVYLQPLLATMIAVLLGIDFLSLEKTIFAALIIGGVYLVNSKR